VTITSGIATTPLADDRLEDVRLELPSAAPAAGAGVDAGAEVEPPPPQPAIMAVIRMVIVHIIGLLILLNLFILFLLGKSNQKILAVTPVCKIDRFFGYAKHGLFIPKLDQLESVHFVTPRALSLFIATSTVC
jgi:hypothetical protein